MFGMRLRMLRNERKLTMKEFGERFKLAESTISGYETGNRKPDIDTVNSFATFFDVSVDYLLGRTDDRQPLTADKSANDEFTPDELAFLKAMRTMSIEELMDKFDVHLRIGGRTATKEEVEQAVKYIKAQRIMDEL